MRKVVVVFLFLMSFPIFLYLNFPLKRFVENSLCHRKISYKSVEVRKFPLKIEIENLKVPSFPLVFNEVVIIPEVRSLLAEKKNLEVLATLGEGLLKIDTDYPISKLRFQLKDLKLESFLGLFSLPFSVVGTLLGNGSLYLEKENLTAGSGSFKVNDLKAEKISFGLLSLPSVDLGKVEGVYKVRGKNFLNVEAKGFGKDTELFVKGYVNLNLKEVKKTYINLKIRLIPKVKPFKGKNFSFEIKGYLENVSIR
ncbi:type II secretion system protein GspN [Desulfurobacterium thermolithotrophum]|uniref:type II secretion system protein GspN n=1 Tax=Desulfurobacterium thermolithotrophum TaxID=64160 RepID=UPI0013D4E7AE|nr:type II secretion system protein GspN [Desulfurobacterium thermolithotrophum]